MALQTPFLATQKFVRCFTYRHCTQRLLAAVPPSRNRRSKRPTSARVRNYRFCLTCPLSLRAMSPAAISSFPLACRLLAAQATSTGFSLLQGFPYSSKTNQKIQFRKRDNRQSCGPPHHEWNPALGFSASFPLQPFLHASINTPLPSYRDFCTLQTDRDHMWLLRCGEDIPKNYPNTKNT